MSPLIFIIFGATGDLTQRKLMPAIFSLIQHKNISEDTIVIGVGRRPLSDDEFRASMMQASKVSSDTSKLWEHVAKNIHYIQGLFGDKALYLSLIQKLEAVDKVYKACIPRFFYLATPPEHYETILTNLSSSKLSEGCGQESNSFTKVLIEKPFGRDLKTAKALDLLLSQIFHEEQIYRIDHYLAKETVQNILAFRFANGMFEPTWNNTFIDHVQITVGEDLGVEGRGALYEGIGATRDVLQNHMMQMLSLIAMEQPAAFDAVSIRKERTRIVASIPELTTQESLEVIRGQYKGFLDEPGVAGSTTETFVAMKLFVNTSRFAGVPFYLRTGKKLSKKVTEISLHYKKPALCNDEACFFNPEMVFRNVLTIRIEPDEHITLRLMVKKPGFGMKLSPVTMSYVYKEEFASKKRFDAYEILLLDAIAGDQTLFAHTDEITNSWRVLSPLLSLWQSEQAKLPVLYEPGSWGPEAVESLIQKDERAWYIS